MSGDLAGFDPADPSTWHPMHAAVSSPMQRAAKLLGVPLGTNMAPGIEHLARSLFPDSDGREVERLRGLLAETLDSWASTAVCACLGDSTCRSCAERSRIRREAGLT